MATKTIGIKQDVYERLKAHKRSDESFSETLDRILHELDADWRTNAGFLSEADADALEAAVERGLEDLDAAVEERSGEIDDRLATDS